VLPLGSGRLRLVRLLLLSEPRVEQLHLVRGGRGIRHAEIAHSLLDALDHRELDLEQQFGLLWVEPRYLVELSHAVGEGVVVEVLVGRLSKVRVRVSAACPRRGSSVCE